jgi:hypothetical protein
MSTKIPRGCIGEFETAPISTTAARFAGMSAANYPGRTVFLTDNSRTYTSRLTRQGSWNPGLTVYTDLWAWAWQEDEFVLSGRGQTVDNATVDLCSYTLPPLTGASIAAMATGWNVAGTELTSRYLFAAFREAAGGIVTVTTGAIAAGSDDGATNIQLIFVGTNTTIHLRALGAK